MRPFQRYFLEVAYKGTHFNGWQIQKNAAYTVQQVLNEQLSVLFREEISSQGSSRTDKGVHAKQNYLHFDAVNPLPDKFLWRINFMLPEDVVVKNIFPVDAKCNARFDAIGRSYEYVLSYRKNPFNAEFACYYPYTKMDVTQLNKATQKLFNHTDYLAFSKRNTQVKTSLCYISHAEWTHNEEAGELTFRVSANRFLRGMVRGLVATMIQVGRGRMTIDEFEKIIVSRQSQKTNFSAPANGLTLVEVKYPENYFD